MPVIPVFNKKIVDVEWENFQIKIKLVKEMNLNLFELTEELFKDFEKIYILDLNGILNYKPQLSLIKKVASNGDIWIDTGVRYSDDIIDPLITDAKRIIVSSKTLLNFDELNKASELSEEVIFGIDYHNGIISHSTRLEMNINQLLDKILKMEIDTIVFYDWDAHKEDKGFNRRLIDSFRNIYIKTYVGGGILEDDFEFLESFGIAGALVDFEKLIEV